MLYYCYARACILVYVSHVQLNVKGKCWWEWIPQCGWTLHTFISKLNYFLYYQLVYGGTSIFLWFQSRLFCMLCWPCVRLENMLHVRKRVENESHIDRRRNLHERISNWTTPHIVDGFYGKTSTFFKSKIVTHWVLWMWSMNWWTTQPWLPKNGFMINRV